MDAMTRAVVLAGGAARGAYGAGVARYIYTELPRHLGWTPWPDLVSGTSVGARNGVFVSSHDTAAVEYISNLWCNLSIEQVYNLISVEISVYGASNGRTQTPFVPNLIADFEA